MVTLAFVGGIVLFILLDLYVMRPLEKKQKRLAVEPLDACAPEPVEILVPKAYLFSPNHLWAHIQETGNVVLGVDEFVSTAIGTVERIETPHVGRRVTKGETLFTIFHNGNRLVLSAPVTGVIASVNNNLDFLPESIHTDPYGAGWVVEVEADPDCFGELAELKLSRNAADWMHQELQRISQWDHLASVDQLRGVLENGSSEVWASFDKHFVNHHHP